MNSKFDQPYTHCPVCGSARIENYLRDFRDIDIWICRKCFVQFMNPVYSDSYLDDYYSKYIPPEYSQDVIDEQRFMANDNLQLIEKVLGKTGRMLDFGCGNGEHVYTAMQRGWNVVGYDVDCHTVNTISHKYSFESLCGPFEEIDWRNETFDLVYTNQVIEHLKHPVKTLETLNRIIKPGGLLLVAVPNIRSLSRRIKFFFEKIGLRRRNIGKYYDSDHHVFYYDKKSIGSLLKVSGYRVLYIYNSKKPRLKQNPLARWYWRLSEKIVPNSGLLVIAKKL